MSKKDLNNESDSAEVKFPVKRTPRSSDSITAGALKLPLADRVQLRNDLNESIKEEVAEKEADAQMAKEIAGV